MRVLDVDAGMNDFDADTIIDELRAERPLLVGTAGHAMVLTALVYVRSASAGQRSRRVIVDPFP